MIIEGIEGTEGTEVIEGMEGVAGMEGVDGMEGVEGVEGVAGVEGIDAEVESEVSGISMLGGVAALVSVRLMENPETEASTVSMARLATRLIAVNGHFHSKRGQDSLWTPPQSQGALACVTPR